MRFLLPSPLLFVFLGNTLFILIRKSFYSILLLAIIIMLSACQGGGGSTSAGGAVGGRVGIFDVDNNSCGDVVQTSDSGKYAAVSLMH